MDGGKGNRKKGYKSKDVIPGCLWRAQKRKEAKGKRCPGATTSINRSTKERDYCPGKDNGELSSDKLNLRAVLKGSRKTMKRRDG